MSAKIGLIGDLHGSWDDEDVRAFNASDYDLLIFTGDLGSGTHRNGVAIARSIAGLTKRTIVMPGNNDAPFMPEIAAEFGHQRGLAELLDLEAERALRHAQIILCGYRLHRLALGDQELTLISARPCAMGGGEFSFPDAIVRNYGVSNMEESTELLVSMVDQVQTESVVLLGHNGPLGLGSHANDIWGCDFRPEEGDWGDLDLATAVARSQERGHRLTVIAGHMHHRLRDGRLRTWQIERDGVLYLNPARVPRIYAGVDRELRYHAALELSDNRAHASEVIWAAT